MSVSGYGLQRLEYNAPRLDVPIASVFSTPAYRLLLEANADLRLTFSDRYDLRTDVSLFYSNFILGHDGPEPAADPTLRGGTFLIHETYANLGFHEHFNAAVGKKRVVWGSGFSWNPTDILNIARDPTDPSLQRVGAWMVLLEVPFERWTLSALWSPQVLETTAGLPTRLLMDDEDGAHHVAGARLYALVFDTDVTLMYWLTDRYGDDISVNSHIGLSLARNFFTDLELHVEAVARFRSSRTVVNPDCVAAVPLSLLGCATGAAELLLTPDADDIGFHARVLVGSRYLFLDSSMLNVEYFYNSEGMNKEEWADRVTLINAVADLAASGLIDPTMKGPVDPAALLGGGGGDTGTPNRFSFTPSRRHYIFLTWNKPMIRDDFTWRLFLILGLEDLSGMTGTSLAWSATEWLNMEAFAFVPFGFLEDSEFGDLPTWARVSLELKAYY